MSKPKECRDCKAEGRTGPRLNAPYPGPRCHRHHLKRRRLVRESAAETRRVKTYSLPPGAYERLLEAQGGVCYICLRKPGKRRLAVDHDHSCCPGPTSCGKCVRGLLCWSDNKHLHHLGDDPEKVGRALAYLRNPPAKQILSS